MENWEKNVRIKSRVRNFCSVISVACQGIVMA
jgi:hypothetical protein